jgi:hypothetical protein
VSQEKSVTSKDGTPIAYWQSGQGPPLVLSTGRRKRRTVIQAQARIDGLRLLRVINDNQVHGEEGGVRADPPRAAHEAGLEVGSERYQSAMAYLLEETALQGDEHTDFEDEGDQHAHGYASYFFTERALALLEGS